MGRIQKERVLSDKVGVFVDARYALELKVLSTAVDEVVDDFASLRGLDTDRVLSAFLGALTGRSDALRRLGVNINSAAIEARALELGLVGVGEELTDTARTLATAELLFDRLSIAEGNF